MAKNSFNQRGSAGILALVVLLVLGTLGAALIALSSTEVNMSAVYRDGVAAQYLAEAGAQWAIAQIKANPNYVNATGVTSAVKNANTATAGNYTVRVTDNATNKIITSTGTVNRSSRTVVLNVTPGSSGGGGAVFKNAIFSKSTMTINANAQVNGDIMSNTKIIVNSHHKDTVTGTAYCNDYTIWYPEAVHNGFQPLEQDGVLDVDKLMQSIPAITKSGTNLRSTWSNGEWGDYTYTLSGGSYYYDGAYSMYGHNYSVPAGKAVTIYVDGNFEIGKKITGNDITIYANGNITFNGSGTIQASSSGKIKLYANGSIELSSSAAITGGEVTLIANNNVKLNSNSSISENVAGALTKIYAKGSVELNSNTYISDQGSGMVVAATGPISLNSNSNAPKIIFVTKGDIVANANSNSAGLYANGKIDINSNAEVNYNSAVIQALGISTGNSGALKVNSYNDKSSSVSS